MLHGIDNKLVIGKRYPNGSKVLVIKRQAATVPRARGIIGLVKMMKDLHKWGLPYSLTSALQMAMMYVERDRAKSDDQSLISRGVLLWETYGKVNHE